MQTEQVNCDSEALVAWRQFCDEHGYDLNDLRSRLAFGGGWLKGAAWGCDEAMKCVETLIKGKTMDQPREVA